MKKLTFLFLTVAMILCAASCGKYKYESVKGDPTATRIYTLDNGLKVYMIVNKDEPRINAQVAVKVGSKNDPRETTGLAHYFEHLMFKGTQQFGTMDYEAEKPMLDEIEALFENYRATEDPEARTAIYHKIDSISYEASKIAIPNEYDKLMASIGARGTNAYTSYDVTCYVENIPSNQIELWAKIQADRFENCVLRGFHTELETIYEEYNMYSALDGEKHFNALMEGLFENHPYNTSIIGVPQHLKNPSITNVKKYHDEWYVPNNMAVVLSGDFDPDKAIAIVDKYFGALRPNENLSRPQYEPERPIESPIVKEVRGNESPAMMMAWRFPGANRPESVMLDVIDRILSNGKAGLIDIDVNQLQKTLSMSSYKDALADYCIFCISGEPKSGQSLDEVRDIALGEIEKLKRGEFDESLLEAIVNNMKLRRMMESEDSRMMARMAVNSFINDVPWADNVNYIDRLSAITKDDVVKFANENFRDNYVLVNKLQEKDPSDCRIQKPQITPIMSNRDSSSQFVKDVQAAAALVEPIVPVFLDFEKDMSKSTAKSGIEVLYKKNVTNGTFNVRYVFEGGSNVDKVLPVACDYSQFLGTSRMTPEQVQKEFYRLACTPSISCTGERTYVSLSGLAENMAPAMDLLESLISDAQPDAEALVQLKANMIQERINAKADQNSNVSRLIAYGTYGPRNPYTNVLSSDELDALTDTELVDKIHNLFNRKHEVLYYGPEEMDDFVAMVNEKHVCPQTLEAAGEANPFKYLPTPSNEIILAPYDANQLVLYSVANLGTFYDPASVPATYLYNEYFGGGMGSIVFQEMREARGLAYSASARYQLPGRLDREAQFYNYIQTQNDKLIDALDAFEEIINDMPVSQNAFDIAKESLLTNIRTARTTKSAVLSAYQRMRDVGLDYDINKDIFEKVQGYNLETVVNFQQERVKNLNYTIVILGRYEDYDMSGLARFGRIRKVTTEEIFGY